MAIWGLSSLIGGLRPFHGAAEHKMLLSTNKICLVVGYQPKCHVIDIARVRLVRKQYFLLSSSMKLGSDWCWPDVGKCTGLIGGEFSSLISVLVVILWPNWPHQWHILMVSLALPATFLLAIKRTNSLAFSVMFTVLVALI